ncbi:MAG: AAA family ATPase [Myxococcales bacterium]|nr:AAA family ATPase [Myxococcales bacterium]
MDPGTLFAGRYRVLRHIESGGEGDLYQCQDLERATTVALKLAVDAEHDVSREGPLLARCRGTHLVEYVAHGISGEGQPFLALEWIGGPDLEARLRQAPLSVQDTVAVGKCVAAALMTLHGAGITHRDVKPGNILLPGGDCTRAKLGDLGMACLAGAERTDPACPQAKAALGTPHYTAPEQARVVLSPGDGDASEGRQPAVDLYALGATLFACLSGHPPHQAAHVMGVLAKLMLEAPPPLADLRGDVPAELDALIASLLAKQPAQRPPSAAAVMQALQTLSLQARPTAAVDQKRVPRERRLLTMLLWEQGAEDRQAVDAMVTRHGGALHRLGTGTRAACFGGGDAGSAAVLRAAHCANHLADLLPDCGPVLATGYGELSDASLAGDVIDRAIDMHLGRTKDDGAVLVDDATAGMVVGRFACEPRGPKLLALARSTVLEAASAAPPSALRRCFGRNRELSSIAEQFEACRSRMRPRITLVAGAPGLGKSLLCDHALDQIQRAQAPVCVLTARGQVDRADARFALLSQWLSCAMELSLDRDEAQRRSQIVHWFDEHFASFEPAKRTQLAVFVGEILGTPFPDEALPILKDVRLEPQAMFGQMRDAFEQTIAHLGRDRPIVLALHDLQWADAPSLRFLDSALRNVTEQAIFVLANARPEGLEALPEAWTGPMLQRLDLRPLSRRACRQLVADAAPERLDERQVEQVIEQSAGTPLYVLEYLRFLQQGGETNAVPGSVLALVGARLSQRSTGERQLLRVASVLGDRFWVGALAEILGWPAIEVQMTLEPLADAELIERRGGSRFEGEVEYDFAHALVREASQATLQASDSPALHLGAARWLRAHGEPDASVLAEHFRLGDLNAEASIWYGRAAEQALLANDLEGVLRHADSALGCGADGAYAGRMASLKGEACNWKGEHERAFGCVEQAMSLLRPGSDHWAEALRHRVWASTFTDRGSDVLQQCELLLLHAGRTPSESIVVAAAHSVAPLNVVAPDEVGRLRNAVEGWAPRHAESHAVQAATHFMAGVMEPHPEIGMVAMQRAAAHSLVMGNYNVLSFCEFNLFSFLLALGRYKEALCSWEAARLRARKAGSNVDRLCPSDVAIASWRSGKEVELEEVEQEIISSEASGWERQYHMVCLAQLALEQGDYETTLRLCAESRAEPGDSTPTESTVTGLSGLPAVALAFEARALLAQGQLQPALAAAERAFANRDACVHADLTAFVPCLRLAYAMALRAAGQHRQALERLGEARDALLEYAASFSNPEFRQSYLHAIPDHHLTLQLFDEWSKAPL